MQLSPFKQAANNLAAKTVKSSRPTLSTRNSSSSSIFNLGPKSDTFTPSRPLSRAEMRPPLPVAAYTKLHEAAEHNNGKALEKLLKGDGRKHLNAQDENGYTPLHIAAESGHFDAMEVLLGTHGIDTDLETGGGATALDLAEGFAEEIGDKTGVRLLEGGRNPLHHAVNRGRIEEMHHIIRGTDHNTLNGQDSHGDTPFHLAALNGNLTAVKKLMGTKGIDTRMPNYDGYTAHQMAMMAGQDDVIKHLDRNLGLSHIPHGMVRSGGSLYK